MRITTDRTSQPATASPSDQCTVAHQLHDTAVVLGQWLEALLAERLLSVRGAIGGAVVANDVRHLESENVWGNAVHRVVTEGISPEQAVDEAIARIKQILAE